MGVNYVHERAGVCIISVHACCMIQCATESDHGPGMHMMINDMECEHEGKFN